MSRVAGWALAAVVILGASEPAAAQQPGGGAGGRGGAPPMTPLVYRQTIMQQLQESLGALTATRNGTVGAPSHVLARAIVVQQLSSMLPEAFPLDSGGQGSRSLPAIWDDRAGFAARVRAMRIAAAGLVEAAREGTAEDVGTAQTAVQQACAGCHMQFRGPATGS